MKSIVIFVVVFGLISCTNPMNKSITEPLTTKEIRKCMKKDSLFLPMYILVEHAQEDVFTYRYKASKYFPLTYKGLRNALEAWGSMKYEESVSLGWEFIVNELVEGNIDLSEEEVYVFRKAFLDREVETPQIEQRLMLP